MSNLTELKELACEINASELSRQIANASSTWAFPHNIKGGEEITCLICKRKTIISPNEISERGMICRECTREQEIRQCLPACFNSHVF